ncbi:hypothetical protein [Kitasatospora sp. NPDC101183]|uniref:hypothetical protein n=1 Tax=Kitasatospora sp. NPDC101183 TaxID=3364100 RepID=UPI00381C3454
MSEGMDLLLELGRREPCMVLAGKPLADQSAMVEGLLAGGWAAEELLRVLAAPLPAKITTSVGAVLSGRLSKLPSVPTLWVPERLEAPVPGRRSAHECQGQDGLCRRPVRVAGGLCSTCRG